MRTENAITAVLSGIKSLKTDDEVKKMNRTVMQCCYTNATKDTGVLVSSGWQAVSVSPTIPENAYSQCIKYQNANSSIQGRMLDEEDNTLNLFELFGDGSYIYIIRTQYGLLDRLGRANMFSHAFIIPCKSSDTISDPNNFLTLARDNFKENEEDAANAISNLHWNQDFDLEAALQTCGLTDDNYQKLIRSVYVKYMDRSSVDPLFIQYDGTDGEMMNLLYCIYSALPLSIRRSLSVGSVETGNSIKKNIIFSRRASEKAAYIIPRTGETNVLSPRSERKLSRLEFVDYTARRHRDLDEPTYFKELEEKAVALGDPTASNELILKIAHQLDRGIKYSDLSSEDIDSMLSDALRSKSVGNIMMDRHIAKLIDMVAAKGIELTAENKEYLEIRKKNTNSPDLKDAIDNYKRSCFNKLTEDEIKNLLSEMSKERFEEYADWLAKSDEGCAALDRYYKEMLLTTDPITWETVGEILGKIKRLESMTETLKNVRSIAKNLLDSDLGPCTDPDKAIDVINKYTALAEKYESPEEADRIRKEAIDTLWKKVNISSLDFDKFDDYYGKLFAETTAAQTALTYCELPRIYARTTSKAEFLERVCQVFGGYRTYQFNNNELEAAFDKLDEQIKQSGADERFLKWLKFFASDQCSKFASEYTPLYGSLENGDYEKGLDILRNLQKNTQDQTFKKAAKLVKEECLSKDTSEAPVPFDVWLFLSKVSTGSYFDIFNKYYAKVFYRPNEEILENSRTFSDDSCINDAKTFISKSNSQQSEKIASLLETAGKLVDHGGKPNNAATARKTDQKEPKPSIFQKAIKFLAATARKTDQKEPKPSIFQKAIKFLTSRKNS